MKKKMQDTAAFKKITNEIEAKGEYKGYPLSFLIDYETELLAAGFSVIKVKGITGDRYNKKLKYSATVSYIIKKA